jgi:hypothetical protein
VAGNLVGQNQEVLDTLTGSIKRAEAYKTHYHKLEEDWRDLDNFVDVLAS